MTSSVVLESGFHSEWVCNQDIISNSYQRKQSNSIKNVSSENYISETSNCCSHTVVTIRSLYNIHDVTHKDRNLDENRENTIETSP